MQILERVFGIAQRGSTLRTEVLAGLVTFLTMSYIIAVNPGILSDAGLPVQATVAATCLGAAIPCLLMGFWANYPIALAPGMGLNAFLTYSLVIGQGVSWQTAMGVVFIEGVLISLLVLVGLREAVMRAIPESLKTSIGVGIGLFIAFIGLHHAGWIAASEATIITGGVFRSTETLIASAGLLLTGALVARRVPGALLLGVIATTIAAAIATALGAKMISPLAGSPVSLPDLSTVGRLDIAGALSIKFATTIFAFMISDFFDTMGTVVAIGRQAKLEAPDGTLPRLSRVLMVDSLAAVWGGLCSASSVTSFVESAAGVGEGGRTGLSSVVVGILFLGAMFFAPLVAMVPPQATAPALIIVGFLMLAQVRDLPFDSFDDAFPAFVTLIGIPLTYSIADGIALGFLTYVLLKAIRGQFNLVSPLLWFIAAAFAVSLAL